ncbi:glycosyltransferase family 9 protein [Dyella sp.]|jgi:ADP-heptose:LPS heptosyltransferase|uniref:glycosyltransferase family 9 protein n=1 Tax=Dyella sp. TaxID=1869338 RepID=UPI002D776BC5|nr:glycosyltransferase family 9 protein [Dyella sp.]HET6430900.1 glycosyltransferase family 9 protein [Dyella sp.]
MAAPTPPQRVSVSPLALALPQALGAEGRATLGGLVARGVHRIVVLRPNHRLGNTLLVTPLLAELEQHFPGAEVDVVTGCEAAGDLLAGFRQVRHVHQLTRRPGHHPVRLFRLLRALRRRRYDLAIDCARGSRSGRWLVHWCRPRQWVAPPADGAELARAGIAWRAAWGKADGHFGLDAVHALRCALGSTEPSAAPMPSLAIRLREEELRDGRATLDQLLGASGIAERGTRVVAIFPNATGSKRLSGSWWREFIAGLSAHDRTLRVIEMVAADGRSQLDGRFPAFYSSDVRRMAALISACDAYISADCGVMHLACATGTPTLGLFTRSNLARYRPYGPRDGAIRVEPDHAACIAAEAATAFLDALGDPAAGRT